MSRTIRFRSRQGFTLIELLVVISIIALLISILLPSLGKAREAAVRVTSLSNAKGLGTSIHTYAADNNAFIPYTRRVDQITIPGEYNQSAVQHNSAGIDIWGRVSQASGQVNGLMGLGALAAPGANATVPAGVNFGSYITVEQLYPPALLSNHGSRGFSEAGEFAKVREWFGHHFEVIADGVGGTDPNYVWWSGGGTFGNFYQKGGYTYRGQDLNLYNGVVTGNANTEWTVNVQARNANTSTPGFNLRTQIMEASSWHAGVWGPEPALGTPNRGGANIIFGDGAGVWWVNEDYASAKLTPHSATQLPAGEGWASRSPVFNDQNQYIWQSLAFNVADIENDRMDDPRP